MASNSYKTCRLCRSVVPGYRCLNLFTSSAIRKQLASRITTLLEVPIARSDRLPANICSACNNRLTSLEKALDDLAAFKEMAKCSLSALKPGGPLKRTKETSGDVGVSPDTSRQRPRSKQVRKRLTFDSLAPSLSTGIQFQCGLGAGDSVQSQIITAHQPSMDAPAQLHPSCSNAVSTRDVRTSSQSSPQPALAVLNANTSLATRESARKSVTVTVSTPSRTAPFQKTLGEAEGKVARALAGGHAQSIASAVMKIDAVQDELFQYFLLLINNECSELCRKGTMSSRFRSIPADQVAHFNWEDFMKDMESKSPLLLKVLTTAVSRADHRCPPNPNTAKLKHPGIVTAAAILLKQRNREMCGLQSIVSLLMYGCHCEKQVYGRLNHMGMCVSYRATLRLVRELSEFHSAPLQKWIQDGTVFKFWGDNVDKQQKVRDLRIDNQGDMLHMFSILVARSRTQALHLPQVGQLSKLSEVPSEHFLPTCDDVVKVKSNLLVLVSRILTRYFSKLVPFAKVIEKHIQHVYSEEMSQKSDVFVLDLLMKNESKHKDMIDIMKTLQGYLGEDYDQRHRVASGGDHMTCEREQGAQRDMMCGNTARERLELLEPVAEDWHCLVVLMGVAWKALYSKSSGDYGTLAFFRNLLNRVAVTDVVKKDVNATVDFLETVMKGHWLASACDVLGVKSLDDEIPIPAGLLKKSMAEQRAFVESIAKKVVDRMTVIDSSFLGCGTPDTDDKMYNYARVLCHYGSLCMEFRDAWAEGDGERVLRCWKLFLPHFKAGGRTKYSLEALRLQFQVDVILSPNLAHQVKWHRFVNTKGGPGKNIPCDLHNEHMNKPIKSTMANMGSNLTESALQYAVRSVSTLEALGKKFDTESSVPVRTTAHSTKPDLGDVKEVIKVLLKGEILTPTRGREHQAYPNIHFDPLHKWDRDTTKKWIEQKKKECMRFGNQFRIDFVEEENEHEA